MDGPLALLIGGQLGAAQGLGRPLAEEPAFDRWLAQRRGAGTADAEALLLQAPCPSAADRFGAARLMVLYGHAAATVALDRSGPPAALTGYSLGFYAAAAAAAVAPVELFLEWVGRVNAENARRFPPGTCALGLCVGLPRPELEAHLARLGTDLAVTAVNNRTQLAFAGPAPSVRAALEALRPVALDARELPLDVPLHGPLMAETARAVAPWLAGQRFCDPDVPLLSPVDGTRLHSARAFRDHLLASLTSPTDWAAVVEGLRAEGVARALDLSPGGDLGRMTRWSWRELPVEAPHWHAKRAR